MSVRQKTVRGSAWIAGSTLLLAGAQFVQLVCLARILGPSDYGVVSILVTVLGFFEMLMVSGISNAIIQRANVTREELSSLHWLNTILGAVIGLGTFFAAPAIADYFNSPAAEIPIMMLSLASVVNSQSHVSRASLEKELRFKPVAIIEFISGICSIVLVVLGASAYGVTGVGVGMVSGFLIRSILFFSAARSTVRLQLHFSFTETRRFLSFGVFQLLNSVVGYLDGNMANLVIGRALNSRALGGYNVAYNLSVTVPSRVNPIVTRVMFPAFSKVNHDAQRFRAMSLKLITFTGLVNTPVLVAMTITAPALVPFVFGDQWSWVFPVVQIMALGCLARSMGNPMGVIIMSRDRQRLGLVINIVKSIASAAVLIYCVSEWQLIGAAVALLINGLLTLIINHFLLRYLLAAGLGSIFASHILPIIIGVPALCVGYLSVQLLEGWTPVLLQIIIVWALVGFTYLATAWLSRVTVLREVVQQLRQR
ncbi:MOP flippase family protein [Glutamicibacter mishrai]|uniref:MOP flippase family protein n=1 Tax=Glutamicibacter mishrai TaxID=1775880 RepID=UPI0003B5B4E2|nr:MOP flippase family protein [Glutamicibacter mishrai]UTT39051.1 MOP flippase family protein [Glutamicibacter mishrai]